MQHATLTSVRTIPRSLRWLLTPVVAIGGCSGSLAVIDAIGRGVARAAWSASIEPFLATDVRVGIAYAVAAFLFVLAALVAPSRRSGTAVVLFACGAAVAWIVLRGWYFPEGHPRAYQPSIVPLVLTLVGGIIGIVAVAAYDRHRRR